LPIGSLDGVDSTAPAVEGPPRSSRPGHR